MIGDPADVAAIHFSSATLYARGTASASGTGPKQSLTSEASQLRIALRPIGTESNRLSQHLTPAELTHLPTEVSAVCSVASRIIDAEDDATGLCAASVPSASPGACTHAAAFILRAATSAGVSIALVCESGQTNIGDDGFRLSEQAGACVYIKGPARTLLDSCVGLPADILAVLDGYEGGGMSVAAVAWRRLASLQDAANLAAGGRPALEALVARQRVLVFLGLVVTASAVLPAAVTALRALRGWPTDDGSSNDGQGVPSPKQDPVVSTFMQTEVVPQAPRHVMLVTSAPAGLSHSTRDLWAVAAEAVRITKEAGLVGSRERVFVGEISGTEATDGALQMQPPSSMPVSSPYDISWMDTQALHRGIIPQQHLGLDPATLQPLQTGSAPAGTSFPYRLILTEAVAKVLLAHHDAAVSRLLAPDTVRQNKKEQDRRAAAAALLPRVLLNCVALAGVQSQTRAALVRVLQRDAGCGVAVVAHSCSVMPALATAAVPIALTAIANVSNASFTTKLVTGPSRFGRMKCCRSKGDSRLAAIAVTLDMITSLLLSYASVHQFLVRTHSF
jgi:hypothetical protein